MLSHNADVASDFVQLELMLDLCKNILPDLDFIDKNITKYKKIQGFALGSYVDKTRKLLTNKFF